MSEGARLSTKAHIVGIRCTDTPVALRCEYCGKRIDQTRILRKNAQHVTCGRTCATHLRRGHTSKKKTGLVRKMTEADYALLRGEDVKK